MVGALELAQAVALVGGTVHPMAPGSSAQVATVLCVDGRIAASGPVLELPAGAIVVDASGLHVIPGLIDGFTYHDPEHDDLYVSAGVTLVRDHGNDLARIFQTRDRARAAGAIGPELSISGAVLDGYPPSSSSALVLKNEHDAHAFVPTMIAEGVDFLSVQIGLGEPAWLEVLSIAHPAEGRHLQVWGPRPRTISLERLLKAGQDGLLFLDPLLPEGGGWESVTAEQLGPAVAGLAQAGTRLTPVLGATARLARLPSDDDPQLELLGPQYAGVWRNDIEMRRESLSEDHLARAERVLEAQRGLLAQLAAAKVTLVPGSGAPHPWLMPGSGLIDELEQWQAAGLPATRCLELATVGSAQALGLEGVGVIEPGASADLVLLRADPRADVSALREVEGVVLRGSWLERSALDRRLAALRSTLAEARARAGEPIEVSQPELPEGEVLLRGCVETSGAGGRISAERWAIVRGEDGSLSFCGRRLAPGGPKQPPIEVSVRQTEKDRRLESFQVTLRTAGHELAVRGQLVAGQMRVERRMDGAFVDNRAAREAIAAIDVSSVTTLLLIAHARASGPLPVIRFDEGLELEVVRWDLALEEDGDHWLRTHNGRKYAAFREDGALVESWDWQGASLRRMASLSIEDLDGHGLPLPDDKLARIRAARATQAGAPIPGGEPPQPPADVEPAKPRDGSGG